MANGSLSTFLALSQLGLSKICESLKDTGRSSTNAVSQLNRIGPALVPIVRRSPRLYGCGLSTLGTYK